jgi:aminoglycoside phosphotransferase family enzyme/predicted kinase
MTSEIPIDGKQLLAAALPHPAHERQIIETHISWVLLTGPCAYKVKKPVRYDFLDYSTAERRKDQCDRELAINRKFAPEIYLEVVPIRQTDTGLCIDGGSGPVVEHAVKMRQFDQECLLARLLEAGKVAVAEMDGLAGQLARYHRDAERLFLVGNKAAQRAREPADDNFAYLLDRLVAGEQRSAVEQLAAWHATESDRLAAWFEARGESSSLRACHGDLHLNNLLRIDGKFLAFDAIEFSEQLRWIDPICEIAFLLMELHEHGYRSHGRRLLDQYLEATEDYAGLRGLRFYVVYRAMVRAKIDLIRQRQNASGKAELSDAGMRYVRYAQSVAESPAPVLWIMHGFSGSGKSTVAQRIVEGQGAIRLRSDVIRKRLMGIDPLQPTPAARLADAYAPARSAEVYLQMRALAEQALQSGFSVIADATFLKRASREDFAELARRHSVPFRIVDCAAPVDELLRRLEARGPDPSDADDRVLLQQIETAEALTPSEQSAVVAVS